MDNWPLVVAMIVTYKRLSLALDTIEHIKQNLYYSGQLGFHIADSGSGDDYIARLRDAIGPDYHTTVTVAPPNVGVNMNMGSQAALERTDFVFHLEDDWRLHQPFELDSSVQLLTEHEDVGMVRMGYISAGLTASVISGAGKLWWDITKSPGFQYSFSGHPSLRHRRWYRAYMPYPEDVNPGLVELGMCENFNSRRGPGIVLPAWRGDKQIFLHTGDSQSIKWQIDHGKPIGYDEEGNPVNE